MYAPMANEIVAPGAMTYADVVPASGATRLDEK
jgi:hypothetical protein